MKLFATTLLVAFIASPAVALSIFSRIDGPEACPENLRIEVKPARHQPGLLTLSVVFRPYEPEPYRGRVGARAFLTVGTADRTLSQTGITLRQSKAEWVGTFDLHPAAFAHSKLSIGSSLHEADGMPTVGGGVTYEIALAGFLP
jgi:hypothetical protein